MTSNFLEISIFEDNYPDSLSHANEVKSRNGIVTSNDLNARVLIEASNLDMRIITPILSGVSIERCVGNMAAWLLFTAMVPEMIFDIKYCLSIDETGTSNIRYPTEHRIRILMSYHAELSEANNRIRFRI